MGHKLKRSTCFALASVATLMLLTNLAAADTGSFADTTADVIYYDWDTDQYSEVEWPEVDIRTVAVDASSTHVTVATTFVELTQYWWKVFQVAYDVTGDGNEDFRLHVFNGGGHELLKVNGVYDSGAAFACGGIGVSVEVTKSRIVTAVPRSCLANTKSAGVSVAMWDSEDHGCDCNDEVLDVWPNQIGTYSAMIPYSDATTPAGSYDPNGPTGTIYRLYRAYFLREPDKAGYDYWLGVYRQGYPLDKISNDFARSTEFQKRYGNLDQGQFLTLVYNNVLGRAPDASGYAYWMDQMNRGMLRGFVMIYFSDSAEFRKKTAAGRPPGY